jgi:hypothetical protein
MNVSVVTVVAMARRSFAVKGFWALHVNIYECIIATVAVVR